MNGSTQIFPYLQLQMNLQHPCLEDCWLDGYDAARDNQAEESNPYKPNTAEFLQWSEGFWSGFYGEQPLFETHNNMGVMATQYISQVSSQPAANEHFWNNPRVRLWATRTLKVAGAIAASIAMYEFLGHV
ncbi:MAG: hypothetical protein JSS53_02225 [Proteobacteria bacterium]|nr:hypothetical protein [Pseudomonadota bacterium]